MARGYYRDQVANAAGDVLAGAQVLLVEPGTSTPVAFSLYADNEPDNTAQANPLVTNEQGEFAFWHSVDGPYDALVTCSGYPTVRETLQLVVPGITALAAETAARIAADAAHAAEGDPHPQYLTSGDAHTHPQADVTDLTTDLAGKAASVHPHAESDVTNLVSDLAGKAATAHPHAESDVTNLVSDLAGKAASVHTHAESDVTNLVSDLAGKAATAHAHDGQLEVVLDGGGVAITTSLKAETEIPYGFTIAAARLVSDASGSIVVDIKDAAFASFPGSAASICGTAQPTLSSQQRSENTTLTSWTTGLTKGHWLEVSVVSAATVKRVTLSLTGTRT